MWLLLIKINKNRCIRVIKSLETSIQKISSVKLILIEIIINIDKHSELKQNEPARVGLVVFGFNPGQHAVRR
jgi:hypothetical protein